MPSIIDTCIWLQVPVPHNINNRVINIPEVDMSPLHYAVQEPYPWGLELMLLYGASPYVPDGLVRPQSKHVLPVLAQLHAMHFTLVPQSL